MTTYFSNQSRGFHPSGLSTNRGLLTNWFAADAMCYYRYRRRDLVIVTYIHSVTQWRIQKCWKGGRGWHKRINT